MCPVRNARLHSPGLRGTGNAGRSADGARSHVEDVEIVHMMTMGRPPYVAPEMEGHFRHNAVFIGGNVRDAINDGRADYTPIYLNEIEWLFDSGAMPIDVALLELSPPDAHGFCSFGVGVDTSLTAAQCARMSWRKSTIRCLARTATVLSMSARSMQLSKSSQPLCSSKKAEITELIRHREECRRSDRRRRRPATGIGGIPDAVLPFLMDRKDLGIHTELVSDNVIPLIEEESSTARERTSNRAKSLSDL